MYDRFADIFSYLKYKTYPKEVLNKPISENKESHL